MGGTVFAKSAEQWREVFGMVSNDFNGDPILILGLEDAKLVRACISAVSGLAALGDLSINNPDKFEKLEQKVEKFLDEVK